LTPSPGRLFFNRVTPGWMKTIHFKESSEAINGTLAHFLTSGVASADFNNDGFVDLLVVTSEMSVYGTHTFKGNVSTSSSLLLLSLFPFPLSPSLCVHVLSFLLRVAFVLVC